MNTQSIKRTDFIFPLYRAFRNFKRLVNATFYKELFPIRNAPSFTPEKEYIFQQLGSKGCTHSDPVLQKITSNIENELFAFGVLYCSTGSCIGGPIGFNDLGLLELENNCNKTEINIGTLKGVKLEGLTFSFILTYYVWHQMLKRQKSPKFAKYMLERLHLAYQYQMNVNPQAVNSSLITHFKMYL